MPTVFIEKNCSKHSNKVTFKVRARTLKTDTVAGQKSRSFSSKKQAETFKKKLESQFLKGDFSFLIGIKRHATIADVIEDYLVNPMTQKFIKLKAIPPLKRMAVNSPLRHIATNALSAYHWYELNAFMVEVWGIKPQTAANYLSVLKSALNKCKVILRYDLNLDGYSEGISTARSAGYNCKSAARTRRPSQDELKRINLALTEAKLSGRYSFPMLDIFHFACATGLRLGEICGKITWNDYDAKLKILTVQERKCAKKGIVNTSRFQVSEEVHHIIISQPIDPKSDAIFPYNSKSVGSAWSRLTRVLEIKNLRFHDLRSEALCRLFESGLTITEISKISGHLDQNILSNYYLRFFPILPSSQAA